MMFPSSSLLCRVTWSIRKAEPDLWSWWNLSHSCHILDWRCSRMGHNASHCQVQVLALADASLERDHTQYMVMLSHLVLQVLRDNHLQVHSRWLHLKGRSLCKHPLKPVMKIHLPVPTLAHPSTVCTHVYHICPTYWQSIVYTEDAKELCRMCWCWERVCACAVTSTERVLLPRQAAGGTAPWINH